MPALGTLEAEVALLTDKLLVFALREHIDPDVLDDTNRLYTKALSLFDADLMFGIFLHSDKTAAQMVREVVKELRDERAAQEAAHAALLRIKRDAERREAEKELEKMQRRVPLLEGLVARLEAAAGPYLDQHEAYRVCEGW